MSAHEDTSIPQCSDCGVSMAGTHALIRMNLTGGPGVWRCYACNAKDTAPPPNVIDLDTRRAGLAPPLEVREVTEKLMADADTLSTVLVIAVRRDGTLYTETSTYDAGTVLYLMERAKMKMMSGGLL